MPTSAEARIKALLFGEIDDMAGEAGALPIAWPNISFTPPATGKWLRVDFIPNRVDRVSIGSAEPHRLRGLMQVSVMWPLGQGTDAAADIAGAIVGLFPADLVLWDGDLRVRVVQRPAVAGAIVEEQRVMVPVTVEWEAFA